MEITAVANANSAGISTTIVNVDNTTVINDNVEANSGENTGLVPEAVKQTMQYLLLQTEINIRLEQEETNRNQRRDITPLRMMTRSKEKINASKAVEKQHKDLKPKGHKLTGSSSLKADRESSNINVMAAEAIVMQAMADIKREVQVKELKNFIRERYEVDITHLRYILEKCTAKNWIQKEKREKRVFYMKPAAPAADMNASLELDKEKKTLKVKMAY